MLIYLKYIMLSQLQHKLAILYSEIIMHCLHLI